MRAGPSLGSSRIAGALSPVSPTRLAWQLLGAFRFHDTHLGSVRLSRAPPCCCARDRNERQETEHRSGPEQPRTVPLHWRSEKACSHTLLRAGGRLEGFGFLGQELGDVRLDRSRWKLTFDEALFTSSPHFLFVRGWRPAGRNLCAPGGRRVHTVLMGTSSVWPSPSRGPSSRKGRRHPVLFGEPGQEMLQKTLSFLGFELSERRCAHMGQSSAGSDVDGCLNMRFTHCRRRCRQTWCRDSASHAPRLRPSKSGSRRRTTRKTSCARSSRSARGAPSARSQHNT